MLFMYSVQILILPLLILQICNAYPANQSPFEVAPPGYTLFENSYYKYHRNPQKWSEARTTCQSEGGDLAIINSNNEVRFLVEMMKKYPRDAFYALIGFQLRGEKFVTIDGKTLEKSGYSHWAWRQPDNKGGNEQCGSLGRCTGLNDISCEISSPFICEISSIGSNSNNFDDQGNAKVDV